MKKILITKEMFEAYVSVQMSGITNMFDINMVCDLTGLLDRNEVLNIMKNYDTYSKKWPQNES